MSINTQKIVHFFTNPWVLVATLVLSFALLMLVRNTADEDLNTDTEKRFPQVFMTSVETREYTAAGQLQHLLQTPLVTRYQLDPNKPGDKDFTLIQTPNVAFYGRGDEPPWLLTAKTGESNSTNTLLRLTNDVLVQQETLTRGLVQITTDELLVHPQEQFAETDKAVKMRSLKGQMDAVGMIAIMQENRVQLKSQVRVVYEPR